MTRCQPFGQAEPESHEPPESTAAGGHDAGAGAQGDASSCADAGCPPACPADACRSCRELHEARPDLGSGVHSIEGSDGVMDVYCDMETAGGGWTLIGRSADDGESTSFGWTSRAGDPSDDAQPYSLDVSRLKVELTEILFGSRADGKTWGASAYIAAIPPDFTTANVGSAIEVSPSRRIGACDGGSMHRFIGHTGRRTVFFFRDKASPDTLFGLKPNGWDTNGTVNDPCGYASNLSEQQGMLFAR